VTQNKKEQKTSGSLHFKSILCLTASPWRAAHGWSYGPSQFWSQPPQEFFLGSKWSFNKDAVSNPRILSWKQTSKTFSRETRHIDKLKMSLRTILFMDVSGPYGRSCLEARSEKVWEFLERRDNFDFRTFFAPLMDDMGLHGKIFAGAWITCVLSALVYIRVSPKLRSPDVNSIALEAAIQRQAVDALSKDS